MKKVIIVVICILASAAMLTGCAADRAAESDAWAVPMAPAMTPSPASAPEMEMFALTDAAEAGMWMAADDVWMELDEELTIAGGGTDGSGTIAGAAPVRTDMAEHIIYTVFADIETLNFDESMTLVDRLMQRYGAFVENSSVSGVNHASRVHGWQNLRHAWFTIRVPVQNLNAMSSDLEELGNVIHTGQNATNITNQFIDTESRLNSLTIQEERLLDMLRVAADVPDLIAIEERLGDVRHQIESLTTTLNTWRNQIDFSTITLNIMEVEVFTEQPERTYWERIGEGFMNTIRGVGNFFSAAFMYTIIAAPVLVILAIIAVTTLLIVRWRLKVSKQKKAQNQSTYNPPPPPTSLP
ncbi:MAG: DUF4349 domain-containing protein [Oscillospiraceae bacterium]|nr:DUF4349 domain-containing protein [Oscillospiraceae bacterium]